MSDIFERAWGNYAAMFEFLTGSDFDDARGIMQPYNFATLLSYNLNAANYNMFLLSNASDYVGATSPVQDNEGHAENGTVLTYPGRLSDEYGKFLDALDAVLAGAVEPSEKPEYMALQKTVEQAQQDLQDYHLVVQDRWIDYLRSNPSIPPEEQYARRVMWEREFKYSDGIRLREDKVRRAAVKVGAWLRAHLPPEYSRIVDARSQYDDRNFWVELPVAAMHDDPKFRQFWEPVRMQFPLLDLNEFLSNKNAVESTIRTVDEHYSRVERKWKVKAKARWGIFGGGGSAQRRTLEELSTRAEFEMKVSFQRFQEVEIYRRGWYQSALFGSVGKDIPGMWGPGGGLAVIPVSLVFARGTRIEVKVSTEYKKQLEAFFSGGGSLRFGPFFSGGGSSSTDAKSMTFRSTAEGFVLEDGEKTVRILGARVRRHNWKDADVDRHYRPITAEELAPAERLLAKRR